MCSVTVTSPLSRPQRPQSTLRDGFGGATNSDPLDGEGGDEPHHPGARGHGDGDPPSPPAMTAKSPRTGRSLFDSGSGRVPGGEAVTTFTDSRLPGAQAGVCQPLQGWGRGAYNRHVQGVFPPRKLSIKMFSALTGLAQWIERRPAD